VTFTDEITTLALEIARSLWAELGVSGSECRHDWQAIDLEPLIIFTASLAAADEAFVTRTAGWCAINSSYISATRLRNLVTRFSPAAREEVDAFMSAAGQRPSSAGESKLTLASGDVPDLRRPALLQLRLRALAGVSVRAEVLKLMLADPDDHRTPADLEVDAGYGQAALAHALDGLTAAGITRVEPLGDTLVYHLARPAELAQAVNGLPVAFPDWISVFTVIDAIRRYAAGNHGEPAGRAQAAKELVGVLRTPLAHLGVAAQVPAIKGESSVTAFEHWARSFVAEHADATQRADTHEVSYAVHRLALGGWIATFKVANGQPRPLALSDVPPLRPERRRHRRGTQDPLVEAGIIVEMLLQDMLTRAMQRRLGSTVKGKAALDPHLPGLSREFAAELLLPMHAGQAATFSEKYLQRWLANHRQWHGISA
jgi:hypothetical protein